MNTLILTVICISWIVALLHIIIPSLLQWTLGSSWSTQLTREEQARARQIGASISISIVSALGVFAGGSLFNRMLIAIVIGVTLGQLAAAFWIWSRKH